MIEHLPKISSTKIGDFRIFKLRSDIRRSHRTGADHDFFVLECVDWVNVIAVTPDNQLVMVEQFRHGSDTMSGDLPGGMMDPGETSRYRVVSASSRKRPDMKAPMPDSSAISCPIPRSWPTPATPSWWRTACSSTPPSLIIVRTL